MNQPPIEIQRQILQNLVATAEQEFFQLKTISEALQTVGLVKQAEEKAEQMAKCMQLQSFYQKKLEALV